MRFEEKWYKKIVIFSLSIFILLLYASAYGAPRIIVTPEEYQFGEINEGERITKKFIIENTGDSDLVINKVKPG